MTLRHVFLSAVAALLAGQPCWAGSDPVIPDALQKEAMTCAGEALQMCPDIWTSEDHGLACMTGKRELFSERCRVIYDKVDNALHPLRRARSAARHDHAAPHPTRP